MLLLLPPSETKRDGGDGSQPLDLAALSFPSLTKQRRTALAALAKVSRSVAASTAALGLGATQRAEIDRNREVRSSPTMPAIERFTGVLYDGLDAASLDNAARAWVDRNVVIHSALFGLVRAGDRIPAYRLSHDSRLPELPLARHWRDAVTAALAEEAGFVLDLRSEAYEALGPAPLRDGSHYLRVVSAASDGTKRALNHFNKKGKGELVRALALAGLEHDSVDSLLEWAASSGIRLERSAQATSEREVFLVV
jgi:cytoplasmic iron level regulating protein YaaA (DUF328/UPF0246 family)